MYRTDLAGTDNYLVYMHTDPEGKSYIGCTGLSFDYRCHSSKRYNTNRRFREAIEYFGWENFRHEILADNLSREEAFALEENLIEKYDLRNPEKGYNVRRGGAHGNSNTEEHYRHLSESHAKKPVICRETGIIYHSQHEAARCTGLYQGNISKSCRRPTQTAGGFHFSFLGGKEMTEQQIWDYLYLEIPNEYAVAGIMGNMAAESNLESNRKQGDFSSDRKASRDYTAAVDSGAISRESFQNDGVGYGLCQWTYWSRKQFLYDYAKRAHASIGDCKMQLDFLLEELQEDYPALYRQLCNVTCVKEASDLVLYQYEKPANAAAQSATRTVYGTDILNRCFSESSFPTQGNKASIAALLETIADAVNDLKKILNG